MNPTRTSVWQDRSFQERAPHWGDFYIVSSQLVEEVADVLATPAVNTSTSPGPGRLLWPRSRPITPKMADRLTLIV